MNNPYTVDGAVGALVPTDAGDLQTALGSSWTEDFDSGPAIGGSLATSNTIWSVGNGSGGSLTGTPAAGLAGNPGVWTLDTGTSNNGRAGILRGASLTQGYLYISNLFTVTIDWVFKIPIISSIGNTFDCANGLGDTISTAGVGQNALIWRALNTSIWACQIISGGVVSPLSLTTAISVTNTWLRTRIACDKTSVKWSIGTGRTGALTQVHSVPLASLPAGLLASPIGQMARIQKLTGALSRSVQLDLCEFILSQ